MLDDVHAALEGPGSVPIQYGVFSGRGMLNVGTEVAKMGTVAGIEAEDVVLFVASDRLTDVIMGRRIQVGQPDLNAANAVQPSDPMYRVVRRSPAQDGLVHALVLEGGI